MDLPQGYILDSTSSHFVCKLIRSIYGLRQASSQWNKKLSDFLLLLGFKQSLADCALFTHQQNISFTITVIYVDDILLTGNSILFIDHVKAALHAKFSIKDLGQAKYYLGLEIFRTDSGLLLSR